ncbi:MULTISPECIES: PAS domain-containing protein [unclassified Bradyrhizobium]|uniref:PAS domain-containing protein n=1 Tax=unclassified Bradyrhizobium TaxID=2631580 RepID=UPI001FFA633E|nr:MULTISPECIES: PAS domain-containing protein [unclassified Bradyrhizobium]MCK1417616.1 PAS domain-containing protein [Bradyrhizobium sp. CW4]MCK1430590.1 PAS domain-containing protein [Bradyrhizobium sp. 87]
MVDIQSHFVPSSAPEASALEPAARESADTQIRRLVGLLRERRPGGLTQVLVPFLARREEALAQELSAERAKIVEECDDLILKALSVRYDALDTAVVHSSFAVAEIDGLGAISYANDALIDHLPDALGRDFASLFGPRSADVRAALATQKRQTLRLDLHRGNLPSIHLRGELGPLTDEYGRPGAYALLLSVEEEEARFDTLPDGILRLDPEGSIVFANERAEQLIGASRIELQGRHAAGLFSSSDLKRAQNLPYWFKSPDGRKEKAELVSLDGRHTPVRVTAAPSFDTAESCSGAIITIVPMAEELVRAELQQVLSDPNYRPEELVLGVMKAVRTIVPYDLATFGVYTEDMRYHKTLVLHPTPDWKWTTAWFPLGEKVHDFLLSDHTWGNDLHATAIDLTPGIEEDPVLQNIVKSGMKGYVTLPIVGGGQRIRASLTLLSERSDLYDGLEVARMRDLGVEKALLVAEANLLRRREEGVRMLQKRLADADRHEELAKCLGDGIADCFGWDYVAVFSVDRRDNLFHIIYQCNRTNTPDVDYDYTQPLTEGLLGATLRDNAALAEPDIEAGSQFGYKPVIPDRRSALAFPIRVVQQSPKPSRDEIEWMLSIESSMRNAFQGPDMVALTDVLAQCEQLLRRRWMKAVQLCLLDTVEQAVVVVDRAGLLRMTNRWADALFGRSAGSLLGERLAAFGAHDPDRRLLSSTTPVAQVSLTLCIDAAVYVPTLASQRPLHDDYGHCLWLFTDLRQEAQQSDLSYLEETVNEVAQHVRLPLIMAKNLLSKTIAASDLGDLNDNVEAALRQLDKADLTYERLASTLAIRHEPDRPRQLFDGLDLLRDAIFDLPREDLSSCELIGLPLQGKIQSFYLLGWPEQLRFAFRSLLGYALFRGPYTSKVQVRVEHLAERKIRISLSVPGVDGVEMTPSLSRNGQSDAAAQQAQENASLALRTVEIAVNRHNGKLSKYIDHSTLVFAVELQATDLGAGLQSKESTVE